MTVEPEPEDLSAFEKAFSNDYLNSDVCVGDMYATWSERDPKYFEPIAKPLMGMRCLRQDPWECTLSFICSQNNNIKRITQLVATIRNNFGQPILSETFAETQGGTSPPLHAFPTLAAFKKGASDAKLRELGFGYRAPYIVETLKTIESKGGESWLRGLRGKPLLEVRAELV